MTVKNTEFRKELETLINRCCLENSSNTPDFILADYVMSCLSNFDRAVIRREEWYGRREKPVAVLVKHGKDIPL